MAGGTGDGEGASPFPLLPRTFPPTTTSILYLALALALPRLYRPLVVCSHPKSHTPDSPTPSLVF